MTVKIIVFKVVKVVVSKGSPSLFALRTLMSHGLSEAALFCVCKALLVSRLTYALPAWSGFASATDRQCLQSVLNKASRWGLAGNRQLSSVAELSSQADRVLFQSVISNSSHVLHHFLPPWSLTPTTCAPALIPSPLFLERLSLDGQ